MNQASYIHDLVEKHHLENAHSVTTPCDNHFKDLSKNNKPQIVTDTPYFSLIGALLWLSNGTWPDIPFSLNQLSSFMTSPSDYHWKAAQRVLLYVRYTADMSVTLGGTDIVLSGHSDSDWAEQREDCRSTTGFLFNLGKWPVSTDDCSVVDRSWINGAHWYGSWSNMVVFDPQWIGFLGFLSTYCHTLWK